MNITDKNINDKNNTDKNGSIKWPMPQPSKQPSKIISVSGGKTYNLIPI
jgi:hypothetical protein